MIQLLATRYSKHIAYCMALIFYVSVALPGYGQSNDFARNSAMGSSYGTHPVRHAPLRTLPVVKEMRVESGPPVNAEAIAEKKEDIGGPSQPEMASFKSIGTDNMVNLFTGDFSYNIPLLDVGGYPVNIFYSGGIGMEQEASWVGLGWNINPGNVNRNMRGIPDDFNGKDTLEQVQKMKPNKTWGFSIGGDVELFGIKNFANIKLGSVGMSFNNYLGPSLELGIKGGINFRAAGKASYEKSPIGASGGFNANFSSRSGLTISPEVSLTAQLFKKARHLSLGTTLSTSYNSRSGIKQLQLSEQMKSNKNNSSNVGIGPKLSTTINFARPSYVPTMRSVMTNEAYAGHFQVGTGFAGFFGSIEMEAYSQKSEIAAEDVTQRKPLVGYLYYQVAANNPNAVMDFTRFNDKEVTPHTPIISAPQYSYDVFSIQGEGTGGTIRPYRSDMGYVRDNYTVSRDKSLSIGADVGPAHYGANFNTVKTPTTSGEWSTSNLLRTTTGFADNSGSNESIYFRNPGETSVLQPGQFDRIGGTDLVRFKLGGTNAYPLLLPVLQRMNQDNQVTGEVPVANAGPAARAKRSQVISFLTAEEASRIGLNKWIKSYDAETFIAWDTLTYEAINRVGGYRQRHHIGQVNVTEADGKRYIYDLPVYNIIQKDFTFTVDDPETGTDKVSFAANEAGVGSPHLGGSGPDGYVQITRTPAYAHSFLLGGLLSPDYVDVTGDGITEDDQGGAVKFNYTRIKQGSSWAVHKWRTPLTSGMLANYNPGNRSETKDDKGMVSYGERESWYLHSVESKTMIAFFILENRHDGKGATDSLSGINSSDSSLKRLKRIDLYNKADLKKNGLTQAKAVKSVHFGYNYSLCAGTPDNTTEAEGKLTLEKIWFTYNGQNRANKNQYVFSYGSTSADNPSYLFSASDRWGTYKPDSANPSGMKNSDYAYALQNKVAHPVDKNAAAWSLKKILLPSGGQIDVEYESDDYAYVQDRRAATMMEIAGFGAASTGPIDNNLYNNAGSGSVTDNDYVFIKVPVACSNAADVYRKYLEGLSQLSFRVVVQMPKGEEYLPCYALINTASSSNYGVTGNPNIIWVKMERVDGMSPLSRAAVEYLREQLPGQAFPGYDVSDENAGIEQIADMMKGWLEGLKSAFKDIPKHLRDKGLAKTAVPSRSFVRLNDPDGFKYGGGHRVKSVKLKDNWDKMTSQYGSFYGQQYDYTTTEVFNGTVRTISSGVASWEPSIGGEENPFQSIVQVANEIPLGPTSYGAIEMPVLDAFFPAPLVGYSKVTVRSLNKNTDPAKKSRSGIGRQVTEFYTARDYPVQYSHTVIDPAAEKKDHRASLEVFLYKYAFDGRALTQGFLVATNDMHGKMKSQSSYAENDPATRINYTQHFYRNTGKSGLSETFDFAYGAQGGEIRAGNMGIDVELMTDTREFRVLSNSLEWQAQVDAVPFPPFWMPSLWPVVGESENVYHAVTTTKVISYHSILDSVVVIDKGSQVSTKNLVYDAETGEVIVNRTNNEFDKAVYSVSYPAYWAYSGMGTAYKNIDAVYAGVDFLDGRIISGNVPDSVIESGDELYLVNTGAPEGDCSEKLASPASVRLLWAYNTHKNTVPLTDPAPDYIFIDEKGKLYTRSGVTFRIVRSGKRNLLGAPAGAVTMMTDPVATVSGVRKLVIGDESKVINASAVEYREKWQTDKDMIKRYILTGNVCIGTQEIEECTGYLEKNINPYRKGLLGNFRGYRSMVFYGDRVEKDPAVATNLPQNGFLDDFALYWDFDGNNRLVPALANPRWVWNSQATRYNAKGMELETKDALNIYTAAQYGFKQTLPVAITANSRYGEMFNEGFEDARYSTGLENLSACVGDKYIVFTPNKSGTLVNTDTLAFGAHTGKFAFRVNTGSGSTYTKTFAITPAYNDSFSLYQLKDTTKTFTDPGFNTNVVVRYPAALTLLPAGPTVSDMNLQYTARHSHDTLIYSSAGISKEADYMIETSHYVVISETGEYNFFMRARRNVGPPGGPSPSVDHLFLTIRDLEGNIVGSASINSLDDPDGSGDYFSIYLCPAVYKIEYKLSSAYRRTCIDEPGNPCLNQDIDTDEFVSHCDTYTGDIYKSLTNEDGCIFTKPIAATDSMTHPVFQLPAGKKMLFSAWVRENCGNPGTGTPCTASTFTNSKVQLLFNDGAATLVEMRPAGPIIEGWQRIEGAFTVPAGATQMTMSLVNASADPIWFDDLRIHPFNANMKSYVYNPVNLRLTAELDANNYASFYEYDEEGTLIRTKAETREGIKTITESRSAKQKNITTID